jgi:hypothetical protein
MAATLSNTCLSALAAAAALAFAGCGGGDDSGGGSTTTTPAAKAATVDGAVTCLKGKGLDASRQSGLSSSNDGDHVRVDYSGGNVVIYVYPSEAVATKERETLAIVTKSSGGSVQQSGNALWVTDPSTPPEIASQVTACLGA